MIYYDGQNRSSTTLSYEENMQTISQIEIRPSFPSRTALIIPCLNEGERLINQITELNELFGNSFDLIVIDGGSVDGSIQKLIEMKPPILQSILLSTIGLGLSHDLFYGFAAIQSGHQSFITVDGNGKDDILVIESLKTFALENNLDFVQGSRFLPGGKSSNLPLDRHFGIKLFISPLISFAAKRKYSDPSNQLRFYSRQAILFLLQVNIDTFKRYDFFFFIPIAMSRSGMKTAEFPVIRTYPSSGPIPSHISRSKYFRLGLDLIKNVCLAKRKFRSMQQT